MGFSIEIKGHAGISAAIRKRPLRSNSLSVVAESQPERLEAMHLPPSILHARNAGCLICFQQTKYMGQAMMNQATCKAAR